jgi:hypothetical protein
VKLDKKELPGQEFILEELTAIRASIQRLERQADPTALAPRHYIREVELAKLAPKARSAIVDYLKASPYIQNFTLEDRHDHSRVKAELLISAPQDFVGQLLDDLAEMEKLR